MKVTPTEIPDVLEIQPRVSSDERGYFLETYRACRYAEAGVHDVFVQDNVSRSQEGTLRGLHLQHPNGQAKLVWVLEGEVLDVAVDVRRGSPTFGKHVARVLSAERKNQLYLPAGFAHGFLVRRGPATFSYKCSVPYSPADELTLRWDDPDLGIAWGVDEPILSDRDAAAARLSGVDHALLPAWPGA